MNDDGRKRLAEFLGEDYDPDWLFVTPTDMMAVKDRLVEKGMWLSFEAISFAKAIQDGAGAWLGFTEWLMHPARFCELANDFLRGQ